MESKRARPRAGGWALLFGAALALPSGCSSDIFDVSVLLSAETFSMPFGSSTGTIPAEACDPSKVDSCGPAQTLSLGSAAPGGGTGGDVTLALACDPSNTHCYAQANARAAYTVDVLQDESFTSRVGRRAVTLVRMLDVAYTIPTNTTTFDFPEIDIYVGPAGSQLTSDPGVVLVDTIPTVAAGTTVTDDPRHLVLADGSPARTLIETNVRAKTPFVFIASTAPRLESGAPLPGGTLVIVMQPLLGLGVR